MGCGASKSKLSAVAPAEQPIPHAGWKFNSDEEKDKLLQTTDSCNSKLPGNKQAVRLSPRNAWMDTNSPTGVSQTSNIIHVKEQTSLEPVSQENAYTPPDTLINSRIPSATSTHSKTSDASKDSGLGDEHAGIITEKSDIQLQEIAKLSLVDGYIPDLAINGVPVNSKPNSLKKTSPEVCVDEKMSELISTLPLGQKHVKFSKELISELPDSPSIIKRPASRGGLAFDVIIGSDVSQSRQKPVLSSIRNHKLSYSELQEKQHAVAQRKKEHEQLIIERIQAKEERDRQVNEALKKFAEMQTELAKIKKTKEETTYSSREAYLTSLKDRLKQKSENVEQIKAAKKTKKITPLRPPVCPPRETIEGIPVNLGAN